MEQIFEIIASLSHSLPHSLSKLILMIRSKMQNVSGKIYLHRAVTIQLKERLSRKVLHSENI